MIEALGDITLKSGERVSAAAIRGPDEAWRERISRLLGHKGDIWRWQNTELLTHETGVEAWFYVLHRAGTPFAHILTAEVGGVGIFGHVWTEPADRGQGASGRLMEQQMAHFRARGGRALYLNTSPGNPAYALYQRHGFTALEPLSGAMVFTSAASAEFEADWFAPGKVQIEPLAWRHWPTAPALFMADIPGVVRCQPLGLLGRKSSEEALLPWIQHAPPPQVFVARKANGAVVGLAAWDHDPASPGRICADVFCHPHFWLQAPALLATALAGAPPAHRVAYADSQCPEKPAVLEAASFRPAATWLQRLAVDTAATHFADLTLFEHTG